MVFNWIGAEVNLHMLGHILLALIPRASPNSGPQVEYGWSIDNVPNIFNNITNTYLDRRQNARNILQNSNQSHQNTCQGLHPLITWYSSQYSCIQIELIQNISWVEELSLRPKMSGRPIIVKFWHGGWGVKSKSCFGILVKIHPLFHQHNKR